RKKDAEGFIHNLNILLRHLGGRTLQNITPRVIDAFVAARLAAGVSKPTVNRQRAVLSKLFTWAITQDPPYCAENPVRKVPRFAESPGRDRYLTGAESEKLIANAPQHLKPVIVTALHTGGRLGEILRLKWEQIDLDRRV